jgi:hypothetical protein
VRAASNFFDAELASSALARTPLPDTVVASFRDALAAALPELREAVSSLPLPKLVYARSVLALETLRGENGGGEGGGQQVVLHCV